jgi:ABC-2 type transport system ATP-binding protein
MIQLTNISKSFGAKAALRELSLGIAPGELYAMLGANGAGKSTVINILLGFLAPDSGTAAIDGRPAAGQQGRLPVAYIPENLALYGKLTGLENLAYFSALAGQRYRPGELTGFLEQAGLAADHHHQQVEGYSKGMRQKTGIAIALAARAKALLLDEPASGLDPQAAAEFAQVLKGLRDGGMAILMATHDLFRAWDCADKIGILHQGSLVAERQANELTLPGLEQLYLQSNGYSA